MRSRRPRSSQHEGKEKGRAPHRFSMRLLHAPIGAPPPFFLREEFLGILFGLAFLGVSKTRVRSGIARTKRLVVGGLDPLLVTTGLDAVVHGAWQNAHWSKLHSAIQHRPPGHLSPRRRFAPFARW
jgi:hypothetical protein